MRQVGIGLFADVLYRVFSIREKISGDRLYEALTVVPYDFAGGR